MTGGPEAGGRPARRHAVLCESERTFLCACGVPIELVLYSMCCSAIPTAHFSAPLWPSWRNRCSSSARDIRALPASYPAAQHFVMLGLASTAGESLLVVVLLLLFGAGRGGHAEQSAERHRGLLRMSVTGADTSL